MNTGKLTHLLSTVTGSESSVIKLMLRLIGISMVLATMTACQSTYLEQKFQERYAKLAPEEKAFTVKHYTKVLADDLFASFRYGNMPVHHYRFAVATFVPVEAMQTNPNASGPMRLVGHQLEQGLMTELAMRGYIAQDYKATNNVIIEEKSDRVFSRNVDELYKHHHNIDFYLSGTLTEMEHGVFANARIIHVDSKDVVAAATRFIPDDVFWDSEKVTTRGGMIYRSESE